MSNRLAVLDGWRGMSILAVLACHLLPLGPHAWELNLSAGLFGMAIFFTLSGFLITSFLLRHADVVDFLIRRLCRILPLAWVALPIGLAMANAPRTFYFANMLFFANYPPFWLAKVTAHFWSLCVEMQFYVAIAAVFAALGRRGLLILLPTGCLAITALRVYTGTHDSIVTYLRADEILAGGVLALAYRGEFGRLGHASLGVMNPVALLVLYAASTLSAAGPLAYLRPYLAALMVGSTLARERSALHPALTSRSLAYVADVSYALYIVHPLLADTWLGSGSKLVKYLKRPLLIAATFAVAHASTFWYEHRWIAFGKRLSSARQAPVTPARAYSSE